jgi:hypothetical protein
MRSVYSLLKRRTSCSWSTGIALASAVVLASFSTVVRANDAALPSGKIWAATWTASMQAPFAAHGPAALAAPGSFQLDTYFPQPDTIRLALADNTARDQTFRMIMRPDIWTDTFDFPIRSASRS